MSTVHPAAAPRAPSGPIALRRSWRRHPVAWLWAVAVLLELALIPLFLFSGADAAVGRAFEASGVAVSTDLVTWFRVVVAEPSALPGAALALAQVASPDLALLLVVGVGFGATGLRAVKRRWRWWSADVPNGEGLRVWAAMAATFLAMSAATAALAGSTLRDAGFVWEPDVVSLTFATSVVIAMFLDAGGLFEESAWRGFALPHLQRALTPLIASVILGVLWSAWHLPVKFDLALAYGAGGFLAMFAVLTAKFVLLSVIMTYFCNRVGGSVPIAIAMHGLSNDSMGLGGSVASEAFAAQLTYEALLVVPMLIVAVALVIATRGRLGSRASIGDAQL